MKILSLHCDYIKFQPKKKAIKTIADLENLDEVEVKEPLGIFVAVEKGDEVSLEKSVKVLVENALDLREKTQAERIVLYPYAHLSADLSKPDFAEAVLKQAEALIDLVKNAKPDPDQGTEDGGKDDAPNDPGTGGTFGL